MRRLYYEQFTIENYLEYCRIQKRLDSQTLKAYRIDLRQFSEQIWIIEASELTVPLLETYIATIIFICKYPYFLIHHINFFLKYKINKI